MSANIVLASGSVIRKQLLRQAGLVFTTDVARIDEESVKASMISSGAKPRDIADCLAEMKANRVSRKHPEAIVIGADQILVCEGQVFDKAKTIPTARETLKSLRGKPHELLSAAVIYQDGEPVWRYVGRAQLVMRDFSDDFLSEYLDLYGETVLSSVGCYQLEATGVQLFSRVQGDYFSVLGFPLLEVIGFLRDRGVLRT